MRDPAGKEMMEALSITLRSLVINVAKAGPRIKDQPVDLLLLKKKIGLQWHTEVGTGKAICRKCYTADYMEGKKKPKA